MAFRRDQATTAIILAGLPSEGELKDTEMRDPGTRSMSQLMSIPEWLTLTVLAENASPTVLVERWLGRREEPSAITRQFTGTTVVIRVATRFSFGPAI